MYHSGRTALNPSTNQVLALTQNGQREKHGSVFLKLGDKIRGVPGPEVR